MVPLQNSYHQYTFGHFIYIFNTMKHNWVSNYPVIIIIIIIKPLNMEEQYLHNTGGYNAHNATLSGRCYTHSLIQHVMHKN